MSDTTTIKIGDREFILGGPRRAGWAHPGLVGCLWDEPVVKLGVNEAHGAADLVAHGLGKCLGGFAQHRTGGRGEQKTF